MLIVDVFKMRTFYSCNLTASMYVGERKEKSSSFSRRITFFSNKSGKEGHFVSHK